MGDKKKRIKLYIREIRKINKRLIIIEYLIKTIE